MAENNNENRFGSDAPKSPTQPQFGGQPNFQQNNINTNGQPMGNPQNIQRPTQPANMGPQTTAPQSQPQTPNAPKQNVDNKKTLTDEDRERLYEFNKDNTEIKKVKKRVKKPALTENARPLYKVRRLYSARIARRMYFEQMLEIARIRALAGESGRKGAALIGAAAKKTKNLVVTLLIVFAILAVIGTGTLVTVLLLNEERGNFELTGEIHITGEDTEQKIDNYRLGTDITTPISISNETGQSIMMKITVTMTANDALAESLRENITNGLDYEDLIFDYSLANASVWVQSDNYLESSYTKVYNFYYVGQVANDGSMNIFSSYKIDLVDPSADYNPWANGVYGVNLTFTVEAHSAQGVNPMTLGWPSEWLDAYQQMYG